MDSRLPEMNAIKLLFFRLFKNRVAKGEASQSGQLWHYSLNGFCFEVFDGVESSVPSSVFREMNRNEFKLHRISLPGKPVIVDIGAHVGIMSIYFSKLFPNARIYAFEPSPSNYRRLIINIKNNQCKNITPRNFAVTEDGRSIKMFIGSGKNTGGCSGHYGFVSQGEWNYEASSVTLDEIIDETGECHLLKIDCEGGEHEILQSSKRITDVHNLIGEFHINRFLAEQGHSIDTLCKFVEQNIRNRLAIKRKNMRV